MTVYRWWIFFFAEKVQKRLFKVWDIFADSYFGIFLFISIIFYILMFAGMLDANIDIRMLKKAGDDSES